MKRLLFLLIVAVTVGMIAGIANAESGVLDIPIVGGDNDVEERQVDPADGDMDRGSSDLELGYDGADGQIIGLRFQDIQIPTGAMITSATVEFKADGNWADDVYLSIWGRMDDPGPFTDAVWTLSTPGIDDETAATVDWTMLNSDTEGHWADDLSYFTPDISTIIQEIIDQSSWSAGNALVIAIGNTNTQGTTQPQMRRRAESANGAGGMEPILHVEYTTGAAPVSPADGGWAYVTLPLLEWARPDPNGPAAPAPLNVDVYFGTNPDMIVGVDTVQIETNQDIDQTGNFGRPLELDTDYYWRVDLIDPNEGGTPTVIPGDVWHFVTTLPAAIIVSESDDITEVSEENRDVNYDTYEISLLTDPASPVTIDLVENLATPLVIATSGNDDAEEHINEGGSIDRGSSDLELGYEGNVNDPQLIGLYYRNIQYIPGKTVFSAYIEFKVDVAQTGEIHLLVSAEKNADPDAISATAGDLSKRIQTDAKIVWNVVDSPAAGEMLQTPDITAVIEEIVSDPDWETGDNIMILVSLDPDFLDAEGLPTGQGYREMDTGPKLYIDWDAPSQIEIDPTQVTLTRKDTPVTITVKAVDDNRLETDPHLSSISHTASSSDAEYSVLTIDDVVVSILENECGAWLFEPYDFNTDCVIDLKDLAMFALEFGMCTDPKNPSVCGDVK